MSLSATECVSPAIEHAKRQLFQPFRFGQWTRLAFVGLLAGEMATGSCGGGGWNPPRSSDKGTQFLAMAPPLFDPSKIGQYLGLIIFVAILVFVLLLVFMYINSVFRFILLQSVVEKRCSISEGWRRWQRQGRRFFLWQLVYQLVLGIGFAILVGIPLGIAAVMGWLQQPKEHLAPLILGGMVALAVLLVFVILAVCIHVLAKDFLVPLMAYDNLDFADGWSRLLAMMKPERGRYVIYLLLKLGLSIAAFVLFGIITFFVVLMFLIPVGGVGILAVLIGKSAGVGWTPGTIALAAVFGAVAFLALFYLIALVSVPAIVFFPAYSIYFFAARYPALDALVHPRAPEPPPLPPLPPLPQPAL
jgi:hypothetical protein